VHIAVLLSLLFSNDGILNLVDICLINIVSDDNNLSFFIYLKTF